MIVEIDLTKLIEMIELLELMGLGRGATPVARLEDDQGEALHGCASHQRFHSSKMHTQYTTNATHNNKHTTNREWQTTKRNTTKSKGNTPKHKQQKGNTYAHMLGLNDCRDRFDETD